MSGSALADLVSVLTLQAGYNTDVVLIGVALLGAAAGVVGTFATLRRRAMMADTLSHAALPGICLAFLAFAWAGLDGRSVPVLLAGATLSGLVGVLTVQAVTQWTRIPEDAAMGAVLSVFFGLGFVLLSHIQTLGTGAEGGIGRFIYGQTAAMRAGDAQAIAAVAALVVGLTVLLFKEMRLVCFDPEFATAQGWPRGRIDLVMMALVVVVTVVGMQAVGLILVIALIVVPAAAARFWTERLGPMTWIAAGIGAASAYLGAATSAVLPDVPAGAVIVLGAGAAFLVSLLLAPARGIVASLWRQTRVRREVEQQHALRGLYEILERAGLDPRSSVPLPALARLRGWSAAGATVVAARLVRDRVATRDAEGLRLTPEGIARAARLVRNHRLWEQFLVSHAELAPSHVDQAADLVEHVLTPELIAELERQLAASGRLPSLAPMPRSVHPIRGAPELGTVADGARP